MNLAPKSGEEAAQFLREAHDGPLKYKKLCLKLQREARGLPAVYPSALAAALSTPKSERVTNVDDLRRGMIGYCDDPNDTNPFAHIFYVAGRTPAGRILTWTNDALRTGGVDVVPLDFYEKSWGDRFMFGATWLNGYDFSDFNAPPVETRGTLGDNYRHAIEDIEKVIKYHKDAGHTILVTRLERDLLRMQRRLKNNS